MYMGTKQQDAPMRKSAPTAAAAVASPESSAMGKEDLGKTG